VWTERSSEATLALPSSEGQPAESVFRALKAAIRRIGADVSHSLKGALHARTVL
jgi:hypothetical protein